MSLKYYLLCFGAMALTMTSVTADDAAVTARAADDLTAAEPSLYSTAYLPPKPVAVGPPYRPYEGAVVSTSTNVVRSPGNLGQVAAFHKTVETPFSSAHHRSDVRYANDAVQQPYYAAGPYPTLAPYPYPATTGQYPYPAATGQYPYPAATGQYPYPAATGQYPYLAAIGQYPYTAATGQYPYPAAIGQYPYIPAAVGQYPYATVPAGPIKPYGYGPVATAPVGPHAYATPVVTPHSVSHASFSGPYGAHYSYKR